MIFFFNLIRANPIRAMKYKKICGWKIYTRACASLARKYTNRTFESRDGTKSKKIVN